MARRYLIDCCKYSSDVECDVKISGSDRKAVLDTAYFHAIGPTHKQDINDPNLKKNLEQMIEEEKEEALA